MHIAYIVGQLVLWLINQENERKQLEEAKEILKASGLLQQQYNDRSAWIFLALTNVRPNDDWNVATTPLLPSINIMDFIRSEYGEDYKPDSREMIRRQFDQAQIVDRNRDNPARAQIANTTITMNQSIIYAYPMGLGKIGSKVSR